MSTKNFGMKRNALAKFCAILCIGLFSSNAMATYITYEVRQTNAGIDNTDYRSSWNMQTSSILSADLDRLLNILAPGSYHHSHLRVELDVLAGQDWLIEIAPDAGYGGALYANDQLVQHRATDLWWAHNWNRSHDLLTISGSSLDIGTNILDLYWVEACCNGGQSGRFSINGGQDWMTLSVNNLESVAVSEPGILILIGSGLLGLAFARRRQQA